MYDSVHNACSSLGGFGQPSCDLYNINWKSILFLTAGVGGGEWQKCFGEPGSLQSPARQDLHANMQSTTPGICSHRKALELPVIPRHKQAAYEPDRSYLLVNMCFCVKLCLQPSNPKRHSSAS